jgi:hypothetical protein
MLMVKLEGPILVGQGETTKRGAALLMDGEEGEAQ